MRTTLTLEPDVAAKLKARMSERKASLKEVVNMALRRGLARSPVSNSRKPFRVQARSLGFHPGIDLDRLNQLADELDVQEFRRRARRGKRR